MFTSVASVFHQAREELRKSRRPTIAASLSDLPVPLPLSTAEVDSLPITQAPLPNPARPSLCGSSMNLEQDIPEIDLGDPTGPFAVQHVKPVKHVKPDTYVLIDMSHLEEITPPQSFVTACCSSSVFSFIKRLFTLY
ncbi:uncharacterized protein LOC124144594 [Haliotis rufescens]|uniref:uncharacterized protein LOC124144594 n=1 Tax=Haliotis rufescens TaxID=6454 RepID=UPI00201EE438|nr:uncharacterized protein LOC124144594 [Haliotis rufescens]